MTPEERQKIHSDLKGMTGKKYLFDGVDVVTVMDVVVEGDIVTFDTDIWTDKFDISSFDDWCCKFVPTRKKSAAIAELEASVLEKANRVVAKEEEIADLKKQLMVMRNVVDSHTSADKPQQSQQPAGNKHESVYPRLYDLLFATAACIADGKITIDQSAGIREICKLVSDISEVQGKVISASRMPERKISINKQR
jgi:hypothetical protein